MKGARALPCANTRTTPNRSMTAITGSNQNFLRVLRKSHISNRMGIGCLSELFGHRIRTGTRRYSRDPVSAGVRVAVKVEEIPPKQPGKTAYRGEDDEKQCGRHDRIRESAQQQTESAQGA